VRLSEYAPHRKSLAIIGAPLDLGQGRRGVDMGPSALRVANLNARVASLGYEVEDLGNVPVEQAESVRPKATRAKYLPQIAATCGALAARVEGSAGGGRVPAGAGRRPFGGHRHRQRMSA
jgi:arginase